MSGRVADYLPQLRYLLLDENRYGEEELAAMHNLVAAIIRFEHPADDQALLELIDLLNDWLAGRPELKRTFALWIRALLLRRSKNTLVLPEVRDLTELKMTLAEKFDQWAEDYKREGETLVLQRQLTRRFDPLPAEVVARFAAATLEDMENWADCSGLIETDTLIGGTYTIVRRKAWHNREGHFSQSSSSG